MCGVEFFTLLVFQEPKLLFQEKDLEERKEKCQFLSLSFVLSVLFLLSYFLLILIFNVSIFV